MMLPEQVSQEECASQEKDLKIGHILIAEGLVTRPQLEEAFRTQDNLKTYKPIGQILVDQDALTKKQLDHILDLHNKRLRLGDILLRSGTITREKPSWSSTS